MKKLLLKSILFLSLSTLSTKNIFSMYAHRETLWQQRTIAKQSLLKKLEQEILRTTGNEIIAIIQEKIDANHVDINMEIIESIILTIGKKRLAVIKYTLLHVAVEAGNIDAVKTLLANKAAPNALTYEINYFHRTPLDIAILKWGQSEKTKQTKWLEIINILGKAGAVTGANI